MATENPKTAVEKETKDTPVADDAGQGKKPSPLPHPPTPTPTPWNEASTRV
jgi:hypothetical protein